jgi:hypothetical protein
MSKTSFLDVFAAAVLTAGAVAGAICVSQEYDRLSKACRMSSWDIRRLHEAGLSLREIEARFSNRRLW